MFRPRATPSVTPPTIRNPSVCDARRAMPIRASISLRSSCCTRASPCYMLDRECVRRLVYIASDGRCDMRSSGAELFGESERESNVAGHVVEAEARRVDGILGRVLRGHQHGLRWPTHDAAGVGVLERVLDREGRGDANAVPGRCVVSESRQAYRQTVIRAAVCEYQQCAGATLAHSRTWSGSP